MMPAMVTGDGRCPECRNALRAVDPRFVRWCDRCGWNVDPSAEPAPEGRVARYRAKLEERLVHALFEELRGKGDAKPGRDLALTAAMVLAGAIHLGTLALFVAGVWLLVAQWHNPFAWLPILALIGVAVAMRPRFWSLESDARPVSRDEAPRLYALVDRVTDELGGPKLDIVLSQSFNASAGRYGFKQRPILEIGLPLWNILGPQERAFVLGHEIGHFVNNDPTRGLVLGSAINATGELYGMLHGRVHWDDDLAFFSAIARGVLRVLALVPHGLYLALELLVLRSKQRAEYLADRLGMRVGSTSSAVSTLETFLLDRGCANALETAVRRQVKPDDLWRVEREYVAGVPPIERERLRRVAKKRDLRIDSTHPPTHLRIAIAEAAPHQAATIVLGRPESELIDKELDKPYGEIAKDLRGQLLRDLYY